MFELPLFPLQTVLFPGTPLQLHIFEPRYRLMMRRCLEMRQPFGVVLIHQGVEAYGPPARPVQVGCTARITQVTHLPDGRMNLTAMGEERFRILKLNESQPYLVGEVEVLPLEGPSSIEIARGARRMVPWIKAYLRLMNQIDVKQGFDLEQFDFPEDPLAIFYLGAALLQVPAVEKQPLLEAAYASELQGQVLRMVKRETALIHSQLQHDERGEEVQHRGAWLN